MWSDTPIHQQVSEPAPTLPTPAKPLGEDVPPEEDTIKKIFDNGVDQGPDGRSKRERKEVNYKEPRAYKCHLGDKQTSPGVRCCTIKRMSYRNRE
jgi:hypothetical protein